jgi:hypothetical protein
MNISNEVSKCIKSTEISKNSRERIKKFLEESFLSGERKLKEIKAYYERNNEKTEELKGYIFIPDIPKEYEIVHETDYYREYANCIHRDVTLKSDNGTIFELQFYWVLNTKVLIPKDPEYFGKVEVEIRQMTAFSTQLTVIIDNNLKFTIDKDLTLDIVKECFAERINKTKADFYINDSKLNRYTYNLYIKEFLEKGDLPPYDELVKIGNFEKEVEDKLLILKVERKKNISETQYLHFDGISFVFKDLNFEKYNIEISVKSKFKEGLYLTPNVIFEGSYFINRDNYDLLKILESAIVEKN